MLMSNRFPLDARQRRSQAMLLAGGALGGAALGVLMTVFAGGLPGGPFVLPTMTAVLGVAAMKWVAGNLRPPRWAVVAAVVLWTIIVIAASVYVIAAIALSNFE